MAESNLQLQRFAKDNIVVLIRLLGMTIFSIGISSIIARTLGTEGKGIYDLSIFLPRVIVVIINIGLIHSTTYFVARQDFALKVVVQSNVLLTVALSAVSIGLGTLIIFFGKEQLFPDVPEAFLWLGLLVVPFLYLYPNLNNIFRGQEDFKSHALIEVIAVAGNLVFLIVLLILLPNDIEAALLAFILGNLSAGLVALWMLRSDLSPILRRIQWSYIRRAASYGIKLQPAILTGFLLLRVDLLLVAILGGGPVSVGIYSIAVVLGERIWTFSGFSNSVLLPRIASWKDEDEKRNQLTLLTARYTFWFSLVLAFLLIVFGQWLINLLYGIEFQASFSALIVLLPGIIMYNFIRVLNADILGRGRPFVISVHGATAFCINLIANFILIPQYDFLGAALASSIAYSYLSLAILGTFARMTGLNALLIFWLPREDWGRMAKLFKMFLQRFPLAN